MPPRPRPNIGLAFSLESLDTAVPGGEDRLSAAQCEVMSRIDEHLYLGSWRDVVHPEGLKAAGITHILNVAKEVDRDIQAAEENNFSALHIPLVDEHRENIIVHLESACNFIEGARRSGGKVLVHCRRGISRSPAIVVGYLMREKRYDFDSAVEYVKKHRACISLNIAFREFLSHYETPHHMNPEPSQFDEGEADVIRETPSTDRPGSSNTSNGHHGHRTGSDHGDIHHQPKPVNGTVESS